jgi:hypothetical protein
MALFPFLVFVDGKRERNRFFHNCMNTTNSLVFESIWGREGRKRALEMKNLRWGSCAHTQLERYLMDGGLGSFLLPFLKVEREVMDNGVDRRKRRCCRIR